MMRSPQLESSDRMEWARRALDKYREVKGYSDEDMDTEIQDLISDLLHVVHKQTGSDPESLVDRALGNFLDEIGQGF